MTKKLIEHSVKIASWDLEGKLSDVINYLKDLRTEYGHDAILDLSAEDDYDYHSVYAQLIVKRLETDAEVKHRLILEARDQEEQKARELAQLKALQEKYKGEV